MTREELLANAKPILFNTEMVKAILEGRKTVTRRVVKPQPLLIHKIQDSIYTNELNRLLQSQFKVGDILYVRETFELMEDIMDERNEIEEFYLPVVRDYHFTGTHIKFIPSIFMPKGAARIFLKVTGLRVERLQEITDEQAIKEGVEKDGNYYKDYSGSNNYCTPRGSFRGLWDYMLKCNKFYKYAWYSNPYVWVIEFERVEVSNA